MGSSIVISNVHLSYTWQHIVPHTPMRQLLTQKMNATGPQMIRAILLISVIQNNLTEFNVKFSMKDSLKSLGAQFMFH